MREVPKLDDDGRKNESNNAEMERLNGNEQLGDDEQWNSDGAEGAQRYVPGLGFRRYGNALANVVPIRRKNKRKEAVPLENAGLFSFLSYSWLSKYIYGAYKKGFSPEEWPSMSSYDGCDLNADRFELLWRDELTRWGAENASVVRVVWRFTRTRFLISNVIYSIHCICAFLSQTLITQKFLEHIQSPSASYEEGIKWASILMLGELMRWFLFSWSSALNAITAMRLKKACMIILYRKVIGLSHVGNASTSELVNLFGSDSQRIFDMMTYGPQIIGGPILIVCGICYLVWLLGPMGLIGMLVFLLYIPIQICLARFARMLRSDAMQATDKRMRFTNEILDCVRLIKMHAWEKCFSKNLLDVRKKELELILLTNYCNSMSMALALAVPVIATISIILIHVSTGQNLTPARAFPISMFLSSQMIPALYRIKDGLQSIMESLVSFGRLKKILVLENESCTVSRPIVKSQALAIIRGTFSYDATIDHKTPNFVTEKSEEEKLAAVPEGKIVDVLHDVTFQVDKGQLIGICGQVGSGKSSLLLAALGQLRTAEGQVMRDGSCAYVSQQAWIMHATLRDNILFGERFDAERYGRALHACNLIYDIETMPGGDQTEIGERGVNLSGGQKQRVALARALYADRDIYFLDDPLSAVDAHVGLHIFNHLITEALRGKTVLFVTHQLQYLQKDSKPENCNASISMRILQTLCISYLLLITFYLNRCDEIYMMRNGRIAEHGTHEELMKMDQEYAFLVNSISLENAKTKNSIPTKEITETEVEFKDAFVGSAREKISFEEPEKNDKSKTTLIAAEQNEEGTIKGSTYLSYIAAAGGWIAVTMAVLLTALTASSSSFSSWWLAKWLKNGGGSIIDEASNRTIHSDNISDNPDFSFYRTVYAAFIGIIIATNVLRTFVFCKVTNRASYILHNNLFARIITSPMRFFDTTPVGRIQNLFSRDMDKVDNKLLINVSSIIWYIVRTLVTTVIIATIFPWSLIPAGLLVVIYYFIIRVYRGSLRGMQRMESTSRSPVLSHVTATIQGLNTIHAFEKNENFKSTFRKLVEKNNTCFFMVYAVSKWLGVRVDGIATLMPCTIAFLAAILKGRVPPAMVGLALTNTVYLSSIMQYTVQIISQLEMEVIGVERISRYIALPETDGENDKALVEVKPDWPISPVIKFENVFMSYGQEEQSVLNGVSFAVEPREKIGIVGRTGAGKSSLTVALFRLVELSQGRITIDDVDISEVGVEHLRSRLSIIPQEPILFSGTIRSNLDPYKTNNDSEIWKALEKTKLKDRVQSIAGQLDATVGFGGENLSVGERQLLCLARALLRHTKILVLDEATAAVDPETETLVQSTIQQAFVDSTVLTIAHRLQTVVTCDRVLVMDDGKVAEFDTPANLLADETTRFAKMIKAAEDTTH